MLQKLITQFRVIRGPWVAGNPPDVRLCPPPPLPSFHKHLTYVIL